MENTKFKKVVKKSKTTNENRNKIEKIKIKLSKNNLNFKSIVKNNKEKNIVLSRSISSLIKSLNELLAINIKDDTLRKKIQFIAKENLIIVNKYKSDLESVKQRCENVVQNYNQITLEYKNNLNNYLSLLTKETEEIKKPPNNTFCLIKSIHSRDTTNQNKLINKTKKTTIYPIKNN